MNAELAVRHGVHTVNWDEPLNLSLRFDYLRADRRDGAVRAEVTVRSSAPGSVGMLLPSSGVILTSSRGRKELAHLLASRDRSVALDGWVDVLETSCHLVVASHRDGEPLVLLRDVEAPAVGQTALEPLLLSRHPSILFGDGGSLKSYLALAAAVDIHAGESLLHLGRSERIRVAFLDWEFDAWEHKERLRLLCGNDMPDVLYRRCVGPLAHQVDALRRLFEEHGIGFVIIDSVGMACEGPPEEAASALGFADAVRQLEVGSLWLAHSNRAGDTEKPFGSVYWHNSARLTWYLKRVQEHESNVVSVGLFNKKANTSKLHAPLGYRFTFNSDRTLIARQDVRDTPGFETQVPLRTRMVRALSTGALTLPELADAVGGEIESVGRVARRYRERGELVQLPDLNGGPVKYALAAIETSSNGSNGSHPRPEVVPSTEVSANG